MKRQLDHNSYSSAQMRGAAVCAHLLPGVPLNYEASFPVRGRLYAALWCASKKIFRVFR